MNATLEALAAAVAARPFARKLLIGTTLGEGREVLRALAAAGVPWIGFEPVTPWIIASELATPTLAEKSLRVADEFEQLALLDEAMDGVLDALPGLAAALADGPGLRTAVADAVRELRHTGIDAALLSRTPLRETARRDALARILRRYEAALNRESALDAAGVFRIALQQVATGGAEVEPADWHVLPGLDRRGLVGRLLDELVRRGARVLPADPVFGLERPPALLAPPEAPDITPTRLCWLHSPAHAPAAPDEAAQLNVFAAGSVPDELREVLRRILAAGLAWDQVEIIATDPVAYGAALDALARRLGIPVGFAAGLPVARTRPGRAIRAWLRWVRDELPADVIREMFERGDLASPDADVSGVALARRLRRLRIGRSRERWEAALDAAERAAQARPSAEDERAPDEAEAARVREGEEVRALASVIRPILAATPDVPDRLRTRDVPVRPSDLARGLLALLRFVPAGSTVDGTAKSRLEKRLARIAETLTRATGVDAAVALLEARLDMRVPAPDQEGAAPWSSAGGRLHLSDLRHGGWTGRPATFVVGLDAGRFPAAGQREAALSDDDRRRLTTGQDVPAMATSSQRVDEARYAFAALLARLRGRVTLSWPAWEAAEARALAPSPELLQAHRLGSDDPTADYDALHAAAGVASPVPREGDPHLDAADVWLGALAEGGALRDGVAAVRAAFAGLGTGLAAQEARTGAAYTAHHGRIRPRPVLDPRGHESLVLSASRLEALGTCPLRYFMRTVLRVRPPDDVDPDTDRWLSPLQRGGLLHAVYETSLEQARRTGTEYEDAAFGDIAQGALDVQIEEYRRLQPPPGGAVFRHEVEGLRTDVRAFVDMIRQDRPDWVGLELSFGRAGREPFALQLGSGTIRLAGAIDRVDRLPDGRLRIVDYKTGSSFRFRQGEAYHGGRRLQHVLYAAVARELLEAEVARVEYQFPTVREMQTRAVFEEEDLRGGLDVVERLLDLAASGAFHPTDDPEDCRFCDYAAVCRVGRVRGKTASGPAEWTRAAAEEEAVRTLRGLRGS